MENEAILDAFIGLRLRTLRYAEGLASDLTVLLDSALGVAGVASVSAAGGVGEALQLRSRIARASESLTGAYRAIGEALSTSLRSLPAAQATSAAKAINRVLGKGTVEVGTPDSARPLVLGAYPDEWLRKQLNDIKLHVRREARLRGTSRRASEGSLAEKARRDLKGLVLSAVQAQANDALDDLFAENADAFKGLRWTSVLDNRTSEICIALSGSTWNMEGKPIAPTTRPFIHPPAHWRCRSILVPFVAGSLRDFPTFDDWLKEQTEADQIESLGLARWRMWRGGKLSLPDMVDQSGRVLRLDEL